jgi:hypothetical protein
MPAFVLPERGAFSVDPDRDFISPARFYAVTGRRQLLIGWSADVTLSIYCHFCNPPAGLRAGSPRQGAQRMAAATISTHLILTRGASNSRKLHHSESRNRAQRDASSGGTLVGSAIE